MKIKTNLDLIKMLFNKKEFFLVLKTSNKKIQ